MEIDKKRRMDDTKLLWHLPRVNTRFAEGERVAPVHIDMGIAKFCNIRCSFCFGKYQLPKPVFIQREALMNTISDAAEIGVKSIGFIGDGEPTCNPHVWDALRLGKQRGLSLAISTSGVLLTNDERRAAILENCEWMRFCFSAGTPEGYEKIHGRKWFDLLVRNIRQLVEYKHKHNLQCEIGLQAVFVPTTMTEEMIAESRLAVELGVDYLVIKQCSLPDDGSSGMDHFDVNLYDNEKVVDALKECQNMSTDQTEIIPKWNTMKKKGRKIYENCPSISLISEISGNGDWYPCGFFFGGKPEFEKYRFGNVHEKRLKEIFESNRYWEIIEHMEYAFNSQMQCRGACRQDRCNEFCDEFRKSSEWAQQQMAAMVPAYTPKGVNFI